MKDHELKAMRRMYACGGKGHVIARGKGGAFRIHDDQGKVIFSGLSKRAAQHYALQLPLLMAAVAPTRTQDQFEEVK